MDVIAEIGSYAEYTVFSERLRGLGFKEDSREGAPLCRWTHDALTLDVMPLDPQVLGFSNRWYPDALHTAGNVQLRSGLIIRAINAPYFLGTKLEAFNGRGKRACRRRWPVIPDGRSLVRKARSTNSQTDRNSRSASAIARSWVVSVAASWFTLSVRSFHVPLTPRTSA